MARFTRVDYRVKYLTGYFRLDYTGCGTRQDGVVDCGVLNRVGY